MPVIWYRTEERQWHVRQAVFSVSYMGCFRRMELRPINARVCPDRHFGKIHKRLTLNNDINSYIYINITIKLIANNTERKVEYSVFFGGNSNCDFPAQSLGQINQRYYRYLRPRICLLTQGLCRCSSHCFANCTALAAEFIALWPEKNTTCTGSIAVEYL